MCKKIKNVTILPGCISCGTCESVCPKVFQVKGIAEIKSDANFEKNIDLINEAAYMCPVNVIKVEEE